MKRVFFFNEKHASILIMPRSMTGFGRAVLDAPLGRFTVEIQSVNRKHFEISLNLPKEFFCFEHSIRKGIKEKIFRGHLQLRLQFTPSLECIAFPDMDLLKAVKEGWERIAMNLEVDKAQVTLPFIFQMLPPRENNEFFEDENLLQTCVDEAVKNLLKMKEDEGNALVLDIIKKLEIIKSNICTIEERTPNSVEKYRERIREKMNTFFLAESTTEERLLREIALFAEKIDISEEITRLKSHFSLMEACIKENGAVGRKMEFVLQEIGREINTIGSKSMDVVISNLIVDSKSELEKIREQIQNVE